MDGMERKRPDQGDSRAPPRAVPVLRDKRVTAESLPESDPGRIDPSRRKRLCGKVLYDLHMNLFKRIIAARLRHRGL